MPPGMTDVLTQVGLGVLSIILLWLLMLEKKETKELRNAIDTIRKEQIVREHQVAAALETYGHAMMRAVEKVQFIVQELKEIYSDKPRFFNSAD